MTHRFAIRTLATAAFAALALSACGSDAGDPQEAVDADTAPTTEGADEQAPADNAGDGAHLDASSVLFDGEELSIADIECSVPDNPDWWMVDVTLGGDPDARHYVNVAGNPSPDAAVDEHFIQIAVSPRADSEHGNNSDEFWTGPEAFTAATDYQISESGTSGTVLLTRQTRPVQGAPMPDGADREITFDLQCP